MCYVDAKKAFDSINRSCLWYKLQRFGIKGKLLTAMQALYQDVQCAVRVNGTLTNWFGVSSGVKQGCVISPTLFGIYVNDLAEEIKALQCGIDLGDRHVSIMLFADDIALISDTEEKLQQMLDCLKDWCTKWRMSLNMSKTKVVHYRHSSMEHSKYEFKFRGETIEMNKKYKYLGLWLDEHLNMVETVKPLAASAGRSLGCLMSKFHLVGGMTHDVFTHLYDSMVAPVLNYGAGIWGTCSYSVINTIQNRACRFFLGVGGNAANGATRGDMGWSSQLHRQYLEVARIYHRVETVLPHRLNGIIHNYCKLRRSPTLWVKKVDKYSNG